LLLISARDLVLETISPGAWAGFWYAGVISMFVGSIAWYHGLAAGGIARISQLNLVLPIFALLWSGLLLGEQIAWPLVATAVIVLASMAVCVRSRVLLRFKRDEDARD
jgi:drug/metabolite transporter (DMT)-like permease